MCNLVMDSYSFQIFASLFFTILSDMKKSVEECLVLVELSFCPVLARVILPLVPLPTWLKFEVLGKFPIGIVLDQLHEHIASVQYSNSTTKVCIIIL